MARIYRKYGGSQKGKRTTYGKAFRKKTSKGKFKKGTWIKYKYQHGRRVGAVRSKKSSR